MNTETVILTGGPNDPANGRRIEIHIPGVSFRKPRIWIEEVTYEGMLGKIEYMRLSKDSSIFRCVTRWGFVDETHT